MTQFITKDNLDPAAFEFDSVNKVIRSKLGLINYSDTPSSYAGEKGKALVVNQAEDGVEFSNVLAPNETTNLGNRATDYVLDASQTKTLILTITDDIKITWSDVIKGASYIILVTQDATGGHTLTFDGATVNVPPLTDIAYGSGERSIISLVAESSSLLVGGIIHLDTPPSVVVGPPSAGDGRIPLFDGISGKLLKDGLPIQGSVSDTTPGAVLQVGSFGIGAAVVLNSSHDLKDIRLTGLYCWDGSVPSNTYQSVSRGYVEVVDLPHCVFQRQYHADGANVVAFRVYVKNTSIWYGWTKFYTNYNIGGALGRGNGDHLKNGVIYDAINPIPYELSDLGTVTYASGVHSAVVYVDTSSSSKKINLPSSASPGDIVKVIDYGGNWGSNSLTVSGKIYGTSGDVVFSVGRINPEFRNVDSSIGWIY